MTELEVERAEGEVQLPGGWLLRAIEDLEPGAVDIEGPSCARTVLTTDVTHPHSRILHALRRDTLSRHLATLQGQESR